MKLKQKSKKFRLLMLALSFVFGLLISINAKAAEGDIKGKGTVTDPYIIEDEEDWNAFVSNVENGNTYSGKTINLSNDIEASTMVGTNSNHFKGTFNGCGYTLRVAYVTSEEYCAPFRYAEAANIKNLKITGSISTEAKYAAGIVAYMAGNSNIKNCISSVTVSSSVGGDGTHGGLIGNLSSGTTNITDCLFNGKLLTTAGTNKCGGFIGWSNGKANIKNCLYAPAAIPEGTLQVDDEGSSTFSRNGKNVSIENSYYTRLLGEVQGIENTFTYASLKEKLGSGWEISNDSVVPVMDMNNLAIATISGMDTLYTLTGADIMPFPVVYASNGTLLTKDTHYTVSWSGDGKTAGDYTVTVTGLSPYKGSLSFAYTVKEADLTITTPDQWKAFANDVSSGNNYSGKIVALGNDLDFGDVSFTKDYMVGLNKLEYMTDAQKSEGKQAYGIYSKAFAGIFDGMNHSIKNATFSRGDDNHCTGFFYSNSGTIKNTTFENNTMSNVIARYNGMIALYNSGTVKNCSISGKVVTAYGAANWGGCVFDTNSGTIKDCVVKINLEHHGVSGSGMGTVWRANSGTVENLYCTNDSGGSKHGTVVYKINVGEGIDSIAFNSAVTAEIDNTKYFEADSEVSFTPTFSSDADDIACNGIVATKNGNEYKFTMPTEDVTVQTVSSLPNRQININAENGSMIANPSTAHCYENVSLTATPDEGYLFNGVTVKTTAEATVPLISCSHWYDIGDDANKASFRMPDSDIDVTPVFTEKTASDALYINMPSTGTVNAVIPEGVREFKLYDNGGATGRYSKYCNGTLTMKAPAGYGFQLEGTAKSYYGYGKLTVANSTETLLDRATGATDVQNSVYNVNGLTSIDNILNVTFTSDEHIVADGLDITVKIIDLSETHNITVVNAYEGTMITNPTSAKPGETVTLTATPTNGYALDSVSVTYDDGKKVNVSGTGNERTFVMPCAAVTAVPTYKQVNVDGGPIIDGLTYVRKTDTTQGYYRIDSVGTLNSFANYVNAGNDCAGMLFKQTADIDFDGERFTEIGNGDNHPFRGTYDGDNYVILNCQHSNQPYRNMGLFGVVAGGFIIKNVNIYKCNFFGDYVGGIVGSAYDDLGTIENCAVIGTLACPVDGYLGGIAGYANCTIKNCFTSIDANTYNNTRGTTGPIYGNRATIEGCYYVKSVSSGNTYGTFVSGGFITPNDGIEISGNIRTIGRTKAHTYYFGIKSDDITLTASTPESGMKTFSSSNEDACLTKDEEGNCKLKMPESGDVTLSLTDVTFTIDDIPEQVLTNGVSEPTLTVSCDDTILTKDVDYTVSYENNDKRGTAKAIVSGKGMYVGTATKSFVISKIALTPSVSISNWTYGESPYAPKITGNLGGGAVTYAYYTDEGCDTKTTTANSGAATTGGVPKNAGTYYIKASVEVTDVYTKGTAINSFTINPKPLSISGISVADKEYDASMDATIKGTPTIEGVLEGDNVSVTGGTAKFSDANIGTGKSVNFTGYSLSGTSADNYCLSGQPSSVVANITARKITIAANNQSVEVYGNIATGADEVTVKSGSLVDGHSISDAEVSTLNSRNAVGEYEGAIKIGSIIIKSGDTDVTNNYSITYETGKLTVTQGTSDIVKAPVANSDLKYTGEPQELVIAGEVLGGTLYYAVTTDDKAPSSEKYTTAIPTATNSGTYYVWYKVIGGDNYKGTEAVCLETAIAKVEQKTPAEVTIVPGNKVVTSSETVKESDKFAINAGFKISQKGSKIRIKWGKVSGADGYKVYVSYYGKKYGKPVMTIDDNSTVKAAVSKIKGKKINLKKEFKVYVCAYKTVSGKKKVLAKTITGYVVGRKNAKFTNAKKIVLAKSSYSVSVGKTAKIKAKTVLAQKGKKKLTNAYAKEFRYASTDKKIATVNKKGKIKGISKGTCNIYVYSRNGYAKKVTVTVK